MTIAFEAYDLCDFLLVNTIVPFMNLNVSFLACFQVVSDIKDLSPTHLNESKNYLSHTFALKLDTFKKLEE